SQEAYAQAIAIEERLIRPQIEETAAYWSTLAASSGHLGTAYRRAGKHPEARHPLQRAVEIYEKLARELPNEPLYQQNLAIHYVALANFYLDADEPENAEAPIRQGMRIREKQVRDHPEVLIYLVDFANSHTSMARCQNALGKPETALEWQDKALPLLRSVLEKEPHQAQARGDLNDALIGRAVCLAQVGQYDQAANDGDDFAN